ncbi:MAG TPA: DUF2304 domain-containing protein [Puia sp.]|jgi:hypothetical protein|nr:DUF2304 domain-containing protein [Puia sp.]
MKVFQVILILAMISMLASYLRRFRRAAFDKILISLILVTGIVFVVNPDLTNRLAHVFGIGRGADLIFYLAMMGFGYLVIILYSKVKKLENQLTALARKQALDSFNQQHEKHD